MSIIEHMSIVEHLQKSIAQALENLGFPIPETIHLEHPRDMSHGDYATNVAMVLGKKIGQNPQDFARTLAEQIQKSHDPFISEVQVAGPGFINITLSQEFLTGELHRIAEEGDRYGMNTSWQDKRILVEHSSPNLFKPFHIGHMMNNTIGEAIARICKTSGAEVTVISYPSDVSLGIGKAVWKFLDYGVETLDEYQTVSEKLQFLGRCYAEGTQAMKDDPDIEPRIRKITQDIYEHRDTPAYEAYKIGRDLNLQYFIQMTARMGSLFDGFIFESESGELGRTLVREHTPAIYSESDGAVIYEGEQDGLHTRVFINKDGNPTYEAKDTGLLKLKFDRYHPDLSVFVTDHQQAPYFEVVITAAGKINSEWKEKTVHKTHGRMQFKGQKMSSRLGNTPIVSDIIDTVAEEVQARSGEREQSQEAIDAIAIGSLKYTILRTQAGKDINFDPDTSLSFEGDSGPYLQYTYARCQSVLNRAINEQIEVNVHVPNDWQTTNVERMLYRYPKILEEAFRGLEPHLIVNYVTELAQALNTWYGQTKIVDAENPESPYKLALVAGAAQVIKNALWTLGIEVLDEM